jgi:hypothetical protein
VQEAAARRNDVSDGVDGDDGRKVAALTPFDYPRYGRVVPMT